MFHQGIMVVQTRCTFSTVAAPCDTSSCSATVQPGQGSASSRQQVFGGHAWSGWTTSCTSTSPFGALTTSLVHCMRKVKMAANWRCVEYEQLISQTMYFLNDYILCLPAGYNVHIRYNC